MATPRVQTLDSMSAWVRRTVQTLWVEKGLPAVRKLAQELEFSFGMAHTGDFEQSLGALPPKWISMESRYAQEIRSRSRLSLDNRNFTSKRRTLTLPVTYSRVMKNSRATSYWTSHSLYRLPIIPISITGSDSSTSIYYNVGSLDFRLLGG